jgi:hypothetical protein
VLDASPRFERVPEGRKTTKTDDDQGRDAATTDKEGRHGRS